MWTMQKMEPEFHMSRTGAGKRRLVPVSATSFGTSPGRRFRRTAVKSSPLGATSPVGRGAPTRLVPPRYVYESNALRQPIELQEGLKVPFSRRKGHVLEHGRRIPLPHCHLSPEISVSEDRPPGL